MVFEKPNLGFFRGFFVVFRNSPSQPKIWFFGGFFRGFPESINFPPYNFLDVRPLQPQEGGDGMCDLNTNQLNCWGIVGEHVFLRRFRYPRRVVPYYDLVAGHNDL